jgi:hypothetical protein
MIVRQCADLQEVIIGLKCQPTEGSHVVSTSLRANGNSRIVMLGGRCYPRVVHIAVVPAFQDSKGRGAWWLAYVQPFQLPLDDLLCWRLCSLCHPIAAATAFMLLLGK